MSKNKGPEKTNAMRALDRAGASYTPRTYLPEGKEVSPEDAPSGVEAAAIMGLPVEVVFKTLVTVGKSLAHYVFVIPVARELDLKKAAKAVGEKSVEMVRSKELFPLTGYVHGGCSEKTVCHRGGREREAPPVLRVQRGQDRRADRDLSRGTRQSAALQVCRPHQGRVRPLAPLRHAR